jgi:hypothetical protein
MFPTKWRNIKHMEHMVCLRCDTANSGYWVQNGKNDYLDFTTNLDCIMLGIHVFGSSTYSGKHDINLTILNSSDVLKSYIRSIIGNLTRYSKSPKTCLMFSSFAVRF